MRILLIPLLTLVFSSAVAASSDGYELLDDCQRVVEHKNGLELHEAGRIKAATCLAYLAGFGGADALSPLTIKGRRMFCLPKGVSLTDAAEVTVEWMLSNKDKLHHGKHEVLAMANIVNYPCGE